MAVNAAGILTLEHCPIRAIYRVPAAPLSDGFGIAFTSRGGVSRRSVCSRYAFLRARRVVQ